MAVLVNDNHTVVIRSNTEHENEKEFYQQTINAIYTQEVINYLNSPVHANELHMLFKDGHANVIFIYEENHEDYYVDEVKKEGYRSANILYLSVLLHESQEISDVEAYFKESYENAIKYIIELWKTKKEHLFSDFRLVVELPGMDETITKDIINIYKAYGFSIKSTGNDEVIKLLYETIDHE
jgi:hypothetical protein